MNDQSKFNNFMSGKKKLTASLFLPIIAAIINTFVVDPETAETLQQLVVMYLPTLVTMAAGWFYTTQEASVDKARAKITVEQEKTKQAEAQAAVMQPAAKPRPINFKAFLQEVDESVEKDEQDRSKAISLYYALIDEGKQQEVEVLDDVWEYVGLVVDAAERKFEEIHGFSITDPDLRAILRKVGKCPYSTVDAYCAYEGNRVALRDVRSAWRDREAVTELVETDAAGYWRTNFDTSLYGLMQGASRLVQRIKEKGG